MQKLISRIKSELENGLPGMLAQQRMSPSVRYKGKSFPENNSIIRDSGVLILLYPKNNILHTVFMKRNEYPGAHSGQISFPGGKAEKSDLNLIETAKREAEEELGIKAEKVELIGQITPLYVPVSGFRIQPVIGFTSGRPDFIPDKTEVQEVIEISLQELFDPRHQKTEILKIKGINITSPYYDAHGHHIWGATAMILSEFRAILNRCDIIQSKHP